MYNSDNIVVCGILKNTGRLVNNSVIQSRAVAIIEGDFEGIGYIADYRHFSESSSSYEVTSQKSAVVIDLDQQAPINRISAELSNGDVSVSITAEGTLRIYGDEFTISMRETESPAFFQTMYRMDIKGISRDVLNMTTVDVVLPTDSSLCVAVFVFNEADNQYDVLCTSEYSEDVRFATGSYNEFYLYNYTSEIPQPPIPGTESKTTMSTIDYLLIASIIAVLAVTVYALITMKRD
jgi:hypothetical protein